MCSKARNKGNPNANGRSPLRHAWRTRQAPLGQRIFNRARVLQGPACVASLDGRACFAIGKRSRLGSRKGEEGVDAAVPRRRMRRPARVASGREPPVGWRGLRATRGAPVRTRISRRVRPHWPVWRSRPPRAGAVASIRTWNPIRCRKLALAVYACPTLGIHVASKMGFGVLKGQCLMSPKEVGTVPTNTRARKCGDFGVKGTRLQMPLAPSILYPRVFLIQCYRKILSWLYIRPFKFIPN